MLDATSSQLTALIHGVQHVARALADELGPAGMQIVQFNEKAAGQTVFHLHFHVIPRYDGDALQLHAGVRADDEHLAALQQSIRDRLTQAQAGTELPSTFEQDENHGRFRGDRTAPNSRL